jgi:ribosomal protein S18 acetylase RimI-like enzyme
VTVTYSREQTLPVDDYIAVIGSTYMRDRRPLSNPGRIERMLRGANIIVTARDEDGRILGLARGMTDDEWVCYIADLAVLDGQHGKGIGTGLLDECTRIIGPGMTLILVAYPEADAFYRRIGMSEMTAFYRDRTIST